jgi:hypothetical protein
VQRTEPRALMLGYPITLYSFQQRISAGGFRCAQSQCSSPSGTLLILSDVSADKVESGVEQICIIMKGVSVFPQLDY